MEQRPRGKAGFPAFAARNLHIRTKQGAIAPFRLNRVQRGLHARLEAQRAATGRVRALVLKARQPGVSTYVEGRFYWQVIHRQGVRAFILTHLRDATEAIFEMAERFHAHNPDAKKPHVGASNAKELYFDELDSGYRVGTAGSKAIGRGRTFQYFHGSEVAHWPNGGAFPAATHEGALDLAAMRDQQISEDVLRSLRVPVSDVDSIATEIPSSIQRANKYLAFDSSSDPIAVDPATASGTSVLATGSTTARLLAERFAETFNVRDYGALGDGTTDDTVAIQAAFDACKAAGGGLVFCPAGAYKILSPLRIWGGADNQTFRIRGDGGRNTTLVAGADFDAILLLEGGAYGSATVAAGAVTAGAVVWGGHYDVVPTVTITDLDAASPGSGATATADGLDADGRVTGVTITDGGAGYNAATTRLTFSDAPSTHLALRIELDHLGFDTSTFATSAIHAPPGSDQHGLLACKFKGSGAISLIKTFANFLQYHNCATNCQGWETVGIDIMGDSIDCSFSSFRIGGAGRGIRIRNDYGINNNRPQGITFTDAHVFTTGKYSVYATDCIFITFNGSWLVEAGKNQPVGQAWSVDLTGPTYGDETSDANDDSSADFEPFPVSDAVGDYCAFGYNNLFEQMSFDNAGGTAGVFNANGSLVWEYWDGSAWQPLTFGKDETVSGASQADPVVVTVTDHNFSDGDVVVITGVSGMTELNGNRYLVANKNDDDFEITDLAGTDIDGTGFGAYTSGGIALHAISSTNADDTAGFTTTKADALTVHWDIPSDWAKSTINGSSSLYYVRGVITTATYSTNPVLDQMFVHEGKERILLGTGANQFNFGAGTYFGGDTNVRSITIKADAGNIHMITDCFFNIGTYAIVAEGGSLEFTNGLIISNNAFQSMARATLDLDSIRNAVITGNVDRSSPSLGSWITRGSNANKGAYIFSGNAWHTTAPALFETGAAYHWGKDTGIVMQAMGVYTVISALAGSTTHGMSRTPSWCQGTPTTNVGHFWNHLKSSTSIGFTWLLSNSTDLQWEAEV